MSVIKAGAAMHKKIMFLCDTLPSQSNTAGNVLSRLSSVFNNFDCCFVCITSLSKEEMSDTSIDHEKILWLSKAPERLPKALNRVRICKIFLQLFLVWFNILKAKIKSKEVLTFASKNNVDIVIVTLQGQNLINFSLELLSRRDLRFVPIIWDDIKWWLVNHEIRGPAALIVEGRYEKLLTRANSVLGASQLMSQELALTLGVPSLPLYLGVYEPTTKLAGRLASSHSESSDKKQFNIGFAGQIYADPTIRKFLSIIEAAGGSINNYKIGFDVYGDGGSAYAKQFFFVDHCGWKHPQDLTGLLMQYDLLYLPYCFDAELSTAMRRSFPSKLAVYFAAGVPVLYHGPADTAVAKYLMEHEAGWVCDSPVASDLFRLMKLIVKDKKKSALFVRAGTRCLKTDFSVERQNRVVLKILKDLQ